MLVFWLAATPAALADQTVDALAGRYGSHFRNGDVSGAKYWSDDVVEIVPVGPDTAYIRLELDFFNGHMCLISGIGRAESGRIVYNDHGSMSPGKPCVLSVSRRGRDLLIDDGGGSCQMGYCGERGSLSDETLPFSSRRPISYMKQLKASQKYQGRAEGLGRASGAVSAALRGIRRGIEAVAHQAVRQGDLDV